MDVVSPYCWGCFWALDLSEHPDADAEDLFDTEFSVAKLDPPFQRDEVIPEDSSIEAPKIIVSLRTVQPHLRPIIGDPRMATYLIARPNKINPLFRIVNDRNFLQKKVPSSNMFRHPLNYQEIEGARILF